MNAKLKSTIDITAMIVGAVSVLSTIVMALYCFLSFDKKDAVFAEKIQTLFRIQTENKNSLEIVNTKLDDLRIQVTKLQTKSDIKDHV